MRPPNTLRPWSDAEEHLLRTQWAKGSTPLIAGNLVARRKQYRRALIAWG